MSSAGRADASASLDIDAPQTTPTPSSFLLVAAKYQHLSTYSYVTAGKTGPVKGGRPVHFLPYYQPIMILWPSSQTRCLFTVIRGSIVTSAPRLRLMNIITAASATKAISTFVHSVFRRAFRAMKTATN